MCLSGAAFWKESWLPRWCWCRAWCWTNGTIKESTRFSLLFRWWAVCRCLCRLHGNRLCHFPDFGDQDRHADGSVQLQMVKWWVSVHPLHDCCYSGRASHMLLACEDAGVYICFWKPGDADLHQTIIWIFLFSLQTLRSSTCTSFLTAQRETMTSCISSSGRSRQRWVKAPWASPVSDASAWCVNAEKLVCFQWEREKKKTAADLKKQRRGFGGKSSAVFKR